MKTTFGDGKKPVTQGQAIVCGLVNQFATPGLGSWMGGRKLVGVGQITLALAGFALVIAWMGGSLMAQMSEAGLEATGPKFLQEHADKLWKAGAISFAVSWVWSLISSVQILMGASAVPPAAPPGSPAPPPFPPGPPPSPPPLR